MAGSAAKLLHLLPDLGHAVPAGDGGVAASSNLVTLNPAAAALPPGSTIATTRSVTPSGLCVVGLPPQRDALSSALSVVWSDGAAAHSEAVNGELPHEDETTVTTKG